MADERNPDRRKSERPARALTLAFALVVLFETWVWDAFVAFLSWSIRLLPWRRVERLVRDAINRLPAIFAVLLFGLPVVAMECGAAFSVVLIALGHVIVGAVLYGLLKLVGVSLVAVIYDLTREKLMTLGWFVWLHGKVELLHDMASAFLAPYREAARAYLRDLVARAADALRRLGVALPVRRRRDDALDPGPEYD